MNRLATTFARFRAAAAAAVVGVLVGLPALAQGVDVGLEAAASTGLSTVDIRTFIGRIVSYFLGLLGIIAVALVMYAGFLWMTSNGNEEKIAQAKRILTNAVIGLVIIVSAFAIVQFVVRAITGGAGGGSGTPTGNCPPGQICGGRLGDGGGTDFKINGIMPSGPGFSDNGWPRNYSITAHLNAPVLATSIDDGDVLLWRCNERLNGAGEAQPFTEDFNGDCDAVTPDVTVVGNKIYVKPRVDAAAADFDSDRWYAVRFLGGAITDVPSQPGAEARGLYCPFTPVGETGDRASANAQPDLCDRAAAFNDKRDIEEPTVDISGPSSPGGFCSAGRVPILATVKDDFLPSSVDFTLNGGIQYLVDVSGASKSSDVNAGPPPAQEFFSNSVYVDLSQLQEGNHVIGGIAQDGGQLSSDPASLSFKIKPAHCCDSVQSEGETGLNCGAGCGACDGGPCTQDSDCASGACDEAAGRCVARPIIYGFDPASAAAGSHVTISGAYFGNEPGKVTFLGSADPSDDVIVDSCAPEAWSMTQIVVAVPSGARTGAIRVTTSAGAMDSSNDDHGPAPEDFDTQGSVHPGICTLAPAVAAPGADYVVNGSGFGSSIGSSRLTAGDYSSPIAVGGWSENRLGAIVPSVTEAEYPVRVTVGGVSSNPVNLRVSYAGSGISQPVVTGVIPENAGPGSYVTIIGSGFGSAAGMVKFKYGADEARGGETVCADSWHNDYIVVKVPEDYEDGSEVNQSGGTGIEHAIQVITATPVKYSNESVLFGITNEDAKPGVCSVTPDNGPPGKTVEVRGTGFGSRSTAVGAPRSSVNFFDGGSQTIEAAAYSLWQSTLITGAMVPGIMTDRSTWPESGPLTVTAANVETENGIPFRVGDCHEAGNECAAGNLCCANGSCQEVTVPGRNPCVPLPRVSAYGWKFSTEVLPSYPVVVENATCNAGATPPVLQSPSPYHNQQDACIDGRIRVQFSHRMVMDSESLAQNVELVECGSGADPVCGDRHIEQLSFDRDGCSPDQLDSCLSFTFVPSSSYNGGTSNLMADTWYQVRLISDADTGTGLRKGGIDSLVLLDGDKDKRGGGNYVFTFRTDDSGDACEIDAIYVDPSKDTINQDEHPVSYQGQPTAANCNILRCTQDIGNRLLWRADDDVLELMPQGNVAVDPAIGYNQELCAQEVTAVAETPLTQLEVEVQDPSNMSVPENHADITVKFAEPRVVAVTPKENCDEACINSVIRATFNVPMDVDSLEYDGNVTLYECRNASCAEPFEARFVNLAAATPSGQSGNGSAVYKHVTIANNFDLKPGKHYLVRIKGGESGVKSRGGVSLGGLTEPGYYTWQFRTRDDVTACAVSSTTVEPARSILHYIGERRQLTAHGFSEPDSCSSSGQELKVDALAWLWTLPNPNPAIGGFVSDATQSTTVGPPPTTLSRASLVPAPGCTARCTLTGSQNRIPQCGNLILETAFEECDTPGVNGCNSRCLRTGASAAVPGATPTPGQTVNTCGDGIIQPNAGETCDSELDNSVTPPVRKFPPGCKQPNTHVEGFSNDALGCVFTGSSTAINSTCGDSQVTDGEACDDGNNANGDGCSRNCLREGTLRTCEGQPANAQCINYCGNGIDEDGEDPTCDPNPSANGCNVATCLKLDPSQRKKGSSTLYSQPSVCGDGLVGTEEDATCEHPADNIVDPYQTVKAQPQNSFDSATANMSKVRAAVSGVSSNETGEAEIKLSCTCNQQEPAQRDYFCSQYNQGDDDLGCATNGCCAIRPEAEVTYPEGGRTGVCRNTGIEVNFDMLMDPASVKSSILVGYEKGVNETCPGDSVVFPASDVMARDDGDNRPRGFFARVLRAITSFFRDRIFAIATAQSEPEYCSVPASVMVIDEDVGEPSARSIAHVFIKNALPPNKEIGVKVLPTVKSAVGVALARNNEDGVLSIFSTSLDICTLTRIEVTPPSSLLSSVNQPDIHLVARGIAMNSQRIIPTTEYSWLWAWAQQPIDEPYVSPIVLTPRTVAGGIVTAIADVRVRGSEDADEPDNYVPTNGQAAAWAWARLSNGNTLRDDASVTVFLCENPWPERRMCGNEGSFNLPWDLAPADDECTAGTTFWYPFYDKVSNYSFHYCRDGQSEGDSGDLLPDIHETPAVVHNPGNGIIREYLFTFDYDENQVDTSDEWIDDALGFRIAQNKNHVGVSTWYAQKGFKGSPSPTTVDGFDALRDGRTTYVNAIQRTGANGVDLHTNIGVISHTEEADPRTINIYDQIVENISFLTEDNFALADAGVCVNGGAVVMCANDDDCRVTSSGAQDPARSAFVCDIEDGVCRNSSGTEELSAGIAVACSADLECKAGVSNDWYADDEGNPQRESYICDADKMKLVRDTKRWADLQAMRAGLSGSIARGALPKLEAGTFLVTMSNSTWPSWGATLGAKAGVGMPRDPINRHGRCAEDERDSFTCFDDTEQSYVCPEHSHVYSYEFFQEASGPNFTLTADFEAQAAGMNAIWRGETCIERSTGSCVTADGLCAVVDGKCNYAVGRLEVGGVSPLDGYCDGQEYAGGGTCGDGVISSASGEVCEPGDVRSEHSTCSAGQMITQVCVTTGTNACKSWQNQSGASCQRIGFCGDGAVNGTEDCDDGSLNGTYGHCPVGCEGDGFFCGDGQVQPGEKCDCGSLNGKYFFNGKLRSGQSCNASGMLDDAGNHPSCAWDCSDAGPRCGDGVINGSDERCDGGYQESPGYCMASATSTTGSKSPCKTDVDCQNTGSGGSKEVCGHYCARPEQRNRRICNTNVVSTAGTSAENACKWGNWTCTAAGVCGDGTVNSGEECDEKSDRCVIDPVGGVMCKWNVCGDGYVDPGAGEQCDEGKDNDKVCIPKYGLYCSYCSSQCKTLTLAGGFCGDNKLQTFATIPNGPEQCDLTLGLSSDFVCVSTRPEFQSYGVRTGTSSSGAGSRATCNSANCLLSCQKPDSEVCEQVGCVETSSSMNLGSSDNDYWLTHGASGYGIDGPLCDICDPDWDDDGIPNASPADCDKRNPSIRGPYSLAYTDLNGNSKTFSVDPAVELCDSLDNNCNGVKDDTEPVDMVFIIDPSGTMKSQIEKVAKAVEKFAGDWDCSQHRFAIVATGMPYGTFNDIDRNRVYMPFSSAQNLTTRMNELAAETVASSSGLEWAWHETTMDTLQTILRDEDNLYGLAWRPEVSRKIIVTFSDTWAQSVACGDGCVENGSGACPDASFTRPGSNCVRFDQPTCTSDSYSDPACYLKVNYQAANYNWSGSNLSNYSVPESLHNTLTQDRGKGNCKLGFGCESLEVWAYINGGSSGQVAQWDYIMGGSNYTRNIGPKDKEDDDAEVTRLYNDLKGTVFAGVCAPPVGETPEEYCKPLPLPEKMPPPPPQITSLLPLTGQVNFQVFISGFMLSNATSVKFNGTPAVIQANSSNSITVLVPEGATDGKIAVVVDGKTLTSPQSFDVTTPPPYCGDRQCNGDEFCPTREQYEDIQSSGSSFGNPGTVNPYPNACGQDCCEGGNPYPGYVPEPSCGNANNSGGDGICQTKPGGIWADTPDYTGYCEYYPSASISSDVDILKRVNSMCQVCYECD